MVTGSPVKILLVRQRNSGVHSGVVELLRPGRVLVELAAADGPGRWRCMTQHWSGGQVWPEGSTQWG